MIKSINGMKVLLDYKEIKRYDKFILYQVYKIVERKTYSSL